MVGSFEVEVAPRAVSARRYAAESPQATLVFAHGAGAGQAHPFITAAARGLSARGIDVVTFNFPYMEGGKRAPDRPPVLEACFVAVVAAAREHGGERPLFIGGKSMGGRMATHVAAHHLERVSPLSGVICFGYPLHPPGRPDQLRVAHLARFRRHFWSSRAAATTSARRTSSVRTSTPSAVPIRLSRWMAAITRSACERGAAARTKRCSPRCSMRRRRGFARIWRRRCVSHPHGPAEAGQCSHQVPPIFVASGFSPA